MSGHTVILRTKADRQRAQALVFAAPEGHVVSIREQTRTGAQNDRLWAMLTDISRAKPEGRRLTPDDWKCVFMHACGWEVQFVEGLDGRPFPQGFRSSKLTVKQMTDLQDFIQAYGDQHGVVWSDPTERKAA